MNTQYYGYKNLYFGDIGLFRYLPIQLDIFQGSFFLRYSKCRQVLRWTVLVWNRVIEHAFLVWLVGYIFYTELKTDIYRT